MEDIFVEGFGTLSLVLTGTLIVIYLLKRLPFKDIKIISLLTKYLRKYHKHLGMMFILISGVHGVSTGEFFSLNAGTITWIFGVLLAISYMLRKQLKKIGWLNVHRILTLGLVLSLVIHLTVVD